MNGTWIAGHRESFSLVPCLSNRASGVSGGMDIPSVLRRLGRKSASILTVHSGRSAGGKIKRKKFQSRACQREQDGRAHQGNLRRFPRVEISQLIDVSQARNPVVTPSAIIGGEDKKKISRFLGDAPKSKK